MMNINSELIQKPTTNNNRNYHSNDLRQTQHQTFASKTFLATRQQRAIQPSSQASTTSATSGSNFTAIKLHEYSPETTPSCSAIENISNNHSNNNSKTNTNSNNKRTLQSTNNSSTSSNLSSSNKKTTKWIKQFCSTEKNQFLCEVDVDYIIDAFNLHGLEEQVKHYRQALDVILDKHKEIDTTDTDNDDDFDDDEDEDEYSSEAYEIKILSSAEILYGLIHARFIMTDCGMQRMLIKYQKKHFGTCIRYYCDKSPMLPIGLSDRPTASAVRLYCPRCKDIYVPHFSSKSVSLDGAYFGMSFPHMFFMVFPQHRPPPLTQSFVPKLYGFKIHQKAYEYQRKQREKFEEEKNRPFMPKFFDYMERHLPPESDTQEQHNDANDKSNNMVIINDIDDPMEHPSQELQKK